VEGDMTDDDRERREHDELNAAAFDVFDELTGLDRVRMLPAMLVLLPLAIAVFIVVAAVLGAALAATFALLHPTDALASGLGLGWFGGSLAITAILLRRAMRRIDAFLRRRNLPTLY
jgi:uncharacterized membrane protein